MSKDKLIPELRFPEFENEGEWELKVFSNFIKLDRGSSPRPIQEFLTRDKSGVNWIKIGDTKNAINSVIYQVEEKITLKGAEKSRRVEKGELILANSMSFGKTYELAINGCIYDGWFVLREFDKYFYKSFLLQLLNSDFMQSQYKRLSAGGIVQNISSDIVYNSKLYHTTLNEQQKIASCLSSLDEVILAHIQKLELLKEHKKGLVQNLFPHPSASSGGEKVPKVRFKEFEKDGDWVEKPLDDVCKLVRGPFGGALKKEIFVEEGFAVYEQSHAIYSDFSSFRYYIDEEKFNELKRFSVKSGDLIMSCSGTMGKFAIVPDDYKIGVINQALLKLTAKKGYDNLFVKMTLESDNNQEKLLSQSAGGAIKNVVSVSQIKELALFFPSIKEQQKIASCLSSLDALITAKAENIAQLKLHKKGLMQGLFPKINE